MILHSKITNPESNKTPLLILHGLFGMLDNWMTLGKKFAEVRPVHLIDLRNHGRSFHSDEMNLDAMAEDVQNYLKHHQLEKVILMGHSLGGKVVLKALNHLLPKIEKMIVVDICNKSYPPHHQNIIKALEELHPEHCKNRTEIDSKLKNYIPENDIRLFLLKNIYRNDENVFTFRFNLPSIKENYARLLDEIIPEDKIHTPILFIRGAQSNYILDEDMQSIEYHYPNANLKTIENAGHWVHAQNPSDFYNAVVGFLS